MATSFDIIESLGGSAKIARETGWRLSTINSWKDAQYIPDWRWPALIRLAKASNVPLSEGDFPAPASRKARVVEPSSAAA